MTLRWIARSVACAALALGGCGDVAPTDPLVARGAQLARDPASSRSRYNRFACLTCHAERATDVGARILPGAVLEGAARRASYWGGEALYLREAVERCWVYFMRGVPEDLDGATGEALWAWLDALSPAATSARAVPFTVPRTTRDLTGGDPARGREVFGRACASCHGAFGSSAPTLGRYVSRLPADSVNGHCRGRPPEGVPDLPTYLRMVVYQKTRHGGLLGYGGTMPPFSTEVLSEEALQDIVALFRCPDG